MLRLLDLGARPYDAGSGEPGGRDPLLTLAVKAGAGERGAQRTLLCAVGPGLLRIIRGVLGQHHPEVEDVFQGACMALLTALPRFRGECTTHYFACRIAVRTALNARRRTQAGEMVDYDEDRESTVDAPVDYAQQIRQREALRRLLDELPAARAEVLVLHVILGYTVEETSTVTEVPVNTVRSRLRRALGTLRERLYADRQLLEVVRGDHEA